MKFTDGNWMMQPGTRVFSPKQAYESFVRDGELTSLAPVNAIRHRGDTLNGPLLRIRFHAPLPDIISVHISHFDERSAHSPSFDIFDNPEFSGVIEESTEWLAYKSGALTARLHKKEPWKLEFDGDEHILTFSGTDDAGYAVVDGDGSYMLERLNLSVGECVYGLGERFTSFVKNGQSVDIWNRDGGAESEQAYKNIPFYMTNRGYGVFVNHPGKVSFEVATEKVSRVQFSVPGEEMEYFVIYGPSPKDILRKYTQLTGKPALPPAWSFGLWLTTSFTTNYDEKTVTDVIDEMAKRDLPLHVFHFDCFWMREFHWCDFQWDNRVFPDPQGMLRRLKEKGLHICVWINPYIAGLSSLFEEGRRNGYLLRKPDGMVWRTDQWQPGMGIVDFTNPSACEWFASKLEALLDMGVDAFKTDFGERIPTDVIYNDGSDSSRMHNFYSYLYNKTVFNLLERKRGKNEAVLFARSATVGGQRFPVHWGGDCFSTYESMATSLRGGLSLGACGFGFWSHDIGGFEGTPQADIYKRWIAFGLLSSHSRLHGSSSYRVPWLFDEESVEVLRFFTKLKCRLMPYLYAKAIEASETGVPVMRPMYMEFPNDRTCDYLDRQYMLGDSLLVAPVFSKEGDVDYYLPEGVWTNFLTGEECEGGHWIRERHGFKSLPLWVRPHSILPIGCDDNRPDYDYTRDVEFRVYRLEDGDGAKCLVPADSPLEFSAKRNGGNIHMNISAGENPWKVLMVGIRSCSESHGGTIVQGLNGLTLTPTEGCNDLSLVI